MLNYLKVVKELTRNFSPVSFEDFDRFLQNPLSVFGDFSRSTFPRYMIRARVSLIHFIVPGRCHLTA
jgi:hypothetical protein